MEAILWQYGLAGVVIFVLAGVVLYQQKRCEKLQAKIDELQEKRLADAVTARDKLIEPIEKQTELSEKIYDFLSSGKRGR